jgi:hypothetical protein
VRKILCWRTHRRCRSPVHASPPDSANSVNRAIIGTLSTCTQIWPGSTKAGTNPKTGIIASTVMSRVMSIHTALRIVQTRGRDCCDA